MRIDAPPLREHPEDIPQIAAHFLQRYSEMFNKPMENIEPAATALLRSYWWPGNVRELDNVIQRAIILAHGKTICVDDLPQKIREDSVANIEDYHPGGSFERQLRDYKVKLAMIALRDNNGNKTLPARSLQISRAYLHRLIRLPDPCQLVVQDSEQLETA